MIDVLTIYTINTGTESQALPLVPGRLMTYAPTGLVTGCVLR